MATALQARNLKKLISPRWSPRKLSPCIQRHHHMLTLGYSASLTVQRTTVRGGIRCFKDIPRISPFLKGNLFERIISCQGNLQRFSTSYMLLQRQVPLTSEQYPSVKRGNFGSVNPDDVSFFESLLPGRVVTASDDLEGANTDWLRICRGQSRVLLKPKTTEEVSKILQYCNSRSLAIVPQGGNTGLVGGSVPVFDEIVVSTSLMNEIIAISQLSGTVGSQSQLKVYDMKEDTIIYKNLQSASTYLFPFLRYECLSG